MTGITSKKQKIAWAELCFALYYFSSALLKPIIFLSDRITSASTAILFVGVLLVLILYLIKSNFSLHKTKTVRWLLFSLCFVVIFVFDGLFRSNELLWDVYFYNFILVGIIPVFFLVNIKDTEKLMFYWSVIALIVGALYLLDPFTDYQWSNGSYMTFGFQAMLPAFAGSVMLYTYFKKKAALVFLICFFVELFICANKGSLFAAIAILAGSYLFFTRKRKMIWPRMIFFVAVFGLIFFLRIPIINGMLQIASDLSFDSYALRTLKQMMGEHAIDVYDSRFFVWDVAYGAFLESPVIGNGIGSLESAHGFYAHNIFLDLASSGGIIALVIFVGVIIWSIKKLIACKDRAKKIFLILLLLLWGIPLLISLTFWNTISFWSYFGLLLLTLNPSENIQKNNMIN